MASDQPLPDRCAARVTKKTGLEIVIGPADADADIDVDEVTLTLDDRSLGAVRLESDGIVIEAEPEYEEVRQFLWDDYEPTMFAVVVDGEESMELVEQYDNSDLLERLEDRPRVSAERVADGTAGSPEGDESVVWYTIGADGELSNVTNRDSLLKGFCERYPMRDSETGRCYSHKGGGAPEGNTNAMTHGGYAQRSNYYSALDEESREFIEALVGSWVDRAPFDYGDVGMMNDLYRCAIDVHRSTWARDEFVDENGEFKGVVIEQVVDVKEDEYGNVVDTITAEEEHPANLPISRLERDITDKLVKLGVYDNDPESKSADAMESLAKQLSGAGED